MSCVERRDRAARAARRRTARPPSRKKTHLTVAQPLELERRDDASPRRAAARPRATRRRCVAHAGAERIDERVDPALGRRRDRRLRADPPGCIAATNAVGSAGPMLIERPQQRDGVGGDPAAVAGVTHPFAGLRLHADLVDVERQRVGQRVAHRRDVRREPRRCTTTVASMFAIVQPWRTICSCTAASSVSESAPSHCGSVSGKCAPRSPSAAAPSSASQTACVERVAVGVAERTAFERNRHPAQDERPALDEPVRVEPVADAHHVRRCERCVVNSASSPASACRRIRTRAARRGRVARIATALGRSRSTPSMRAARDSSSVTRRRPRAANEAFDQQHFFFGGHRVARVACSARTRSAGA